LRRLARELDGPRAAREKLEKKLTGKICEKSLLFLQYSSANPAE